MRIAILNQLLVVEKVLQWFRESGLRERCKSKVQLPSLSLELRLI